MQVAHRRRSVFPMLYSDKGRIESAARPQALGCHSDLQTRMGVFETAGGHAGDSYRYAKPAARICFPVLWRHYRLGVSIHGRDCGVKDGRGRRECFLVGIFCGETIGEGEGGGRGGGGPPRRSNVRAQAVGGKRMKTLGCGGGYGRERSWGAELVGRGALPAYYQGSRKNIPWSIWIEVRSCAGLNTARGTPV